MPSPEQSEKIKNRIDIISNPLYVVKQGNSGERHGPEEWQCHYWTARDATNNVFNIDNKATWDERNLFQSQSVLRLKDEKDPGKMSVQDDFKKVVRSLAMAEHQDGMGNA